MMRRRRIVFTAAGGRGKTERRGAGSLAFRSCCASCRPPAPAARRRTSVGQGWQQPRAGRGTSSWGRPTDRPRQQSRSLLLPPPSPHPARRRWSELACDDVVASFVTDVTFVVMSSAVDSASKASSCAPAAAPRLPPLPPSAARPAPRVRVDRAGNARTPGTYLVTLPSSI